MQTSATSIFKTRWALAMRDSRSGQQVEIRLNAQGKPDFFAAEARLRQLTRAKSSLDKNPKSKKKAAYDYSTGVHGAFGFKRPRPYGAPLLVLVPVKPKTESTPVKVASAPKPSAPSKAAKKAVAALPKFPPAKTAAAKPTLAKAPTPKPAPTAVPSKAPIAPPAAKPTGPGSSKDHPILYSRSEMIDGDIVIHKTDGGILRLAKASSEYRSHGGGLGSIKTAQGVLWFRHVPPVETPAIAAKSEPAPLPKAQEPPAAKLGGPAAPIAEIPSAASSSTPSTFSGVSDPEAADYNQPVPGYPTAKAPMYLWKHKDKNEFLAVFEGKRMKLNEAQFLSLHKGAHPELFSKNSKPLPKAPAPGAGADW